MHMDCPGCESKIRKALHKLDGIIPFPPKKEKIVLLLVINNEHIFNRTNMYLYRSG